jgi:hypothetical protein
MTFRAKLPVRLFTAVSGMGFVALLDAYITRLDTNCSDISAPVDPLLARISGESTSTQNCALYHARHRNFKTLPSFSQKISRYGLKTGAADWAAHDA